MTWLTTWPEAAVPHYAEHPSEAAAEVHAASLVRRGVAHAVVFEMDQRGGRVPESHRAGPRSDAGAERAPGVDRDDEQRREGTK